MTNCTVYVVVVSGRDDRALDQAARYWLDTVNTFAPNCPIILTISKCDPDGNEHVSLNERQLRERYVHLQAPIVRTSAKTGLHVDELWSSIKRYIRFSRITQPRRRTP